MTARKYFIIYDFIIHPILLIILLYLIIKKHCNLCIYILAFENIGLHIIKKLIKCPKCNTPIYRKGSWKMLAEKFCRNCGHNLNKKLPKQ